MTELTALPVEVHAVILQLHAKRTQYNSGAFALYAQVCKWWARLQRDAINVLICVAVRCNPDKWHAALALPPPPTPLTTPTLFRNVARKRSALMDLYYTHDGWNGLTKRLCVRAQRGAKRKR